MNGLRSSSDRAKDVEIRRGHRCIGVLTELGWIGVSHVGKLK